MLKRNEVIIGNGTLPENKQVSELDSIREELGYLTASGLKYLQIDIANCYGLDKKSYEERIAFVDEHTTNELLAKTIVADSPYEYRNAVEQYERACMGYPVEHITYLDCTTKHYNFMQY